MDSENSGVTAFDCTYLVWSFPNVSRNRVTFIFRDRQILGLGYLILEEGRHLETAQQATVTSQETWIVRINGGRNPVLII